MLRAFAAERLVKLNTILEDIFETHLHQKRKLSLAYAAMGVLASESLFLHELGAGLVKTRGGHKKHATKQIDRLLSNPGISIWALSEHWVPYVVGEQKNLFCALDWTSLAGDKQWMLSLNIITAKGLSTPLLWKTVATSCYAELREK